MQLTPVIEISEGDKVLHEGEVISRVTKRKWTTIEFSPRDGLNTSLKLLNTQKLWVKESHVGEVN